MRAMKSRFAPMLLVCGSALLLSLSGCGGGGSSSGGGGTKVSSIAITPTSASIAEGATQQFTAVAKDANGATISGVSFTWSSSDTGVATINASGLATGVATGTTSITASAQGVTSPAAALSVTTAPPSTPLQGQYAFLVSGYDSGMAGSVTLDGHGNVTGGNEDILAPGTTNLSGSDLTISIGTYSVGSDGRGTLSYTDSNGNSFTFAIAIGDITAGIATQGQMIEFDSNPLEMTGSLALQTSADFSTSALTGAYAFGDSGWDSDSDPDVAVGSFTAGNGAVSNGLLDENDAGMVTPPTAFTGSISSINGNGRGTIIITPTGGGSAGTDDFYVVSAGKLFFITDPSSPGVKMGQALQQTGGPFSGSSLSGVTVLQVQSETDMPAPSATLGLVTFGSGSAFSSTLM
ncbi:MAG: Ig-like domain-containing protein [Gammaproteobacteria bacterium]